MVFQPVKFQFQVEIPPTAEDVKNSEIPPTGESVRKVTNPTHGSGWIFSGPAYITVARAPRFYSFPRARKNDNNVIRRHLPVGRTWTIHPLAWVGFVHIFGRGWDSEKCGITGRPFVGRTRTIHPLPWVGIHSLWTIS